MVIKLVIFNGPPRSGKDTSTNFALSYLNNRGVFYRFAEPLKNATHALFNIPNVSTEHFDSVKGIPNELFLGSTPRQAYIDMSEKMVKPFYGKDFFSRIAIKSIRNLAKEVMADPVVVISDCGFDAEVFDAKYEFGGENIALVHLFRPGCTYEGDSRNYVNVEGCKRYDINNAGTLEELEKAVQDLIEDFLNASQS